MAEAAGKGDKLNVFISYSRDDLGFADQLDAALGLAGFGTSIDRLGISGGEDWKARLGALIRDADTIVFVLSPSSARSQICVWEVEEAVRLGKRILPVLCRPLEGATPPPRLAELNYIFFYEEPRFPGSGFGSGLVRLAAALNTDIDWLREHTRYLQRATEWDAGGRPANRLLSGPDIATAKAWVARRPKNAPEPTEVQLDFIKASEAEETRQKNRVEGKAEAAKLSRVFISYRREDSAGFAWGIYDRLARRLGRSNIFFDVDNIAPGLDFVDVLSERVSKCDALVAIIGADWVSSVDRDNRRRIDDPHDFVRIEIEAALERGILVIPVLVDGAAMPSADDLPDSLKKLARRQGIEVSHTRFDSDIRKLVHTLSQFAWPKQRKRRSAGSS
jgi:TIR domain-containing protein